MKKEVFDRLKDYVLDYTDESEYAEVFNIFAKSISEYEWEPAQTEYAFNIMDNEQAAKAVSMFGFDSVCKATKDGWIMVAKKVAKDKWEFLSKSPSAILSERFEDLIYDVISHANRYPEWLTEQVGKALVFELRCE